MTCYAIFRLSLRENLVKFLLLGKINNDIKLPTSPLFYHRKITCQASFYFMLPIERLEKSNTKENLWIYILSLLKEKGLYGWEIQSLIEEKFNFRPGLITPYRVLYRLEQNGFVKSKLKERRRIYQITENGKKELKLAKDFYKAILKKII